MLPGMDGFTLLQKLRKSGSSVPVLMLTARGELEDRVRGLENGADYYLPKPFEKEELFKQHELQLEEYKRLGRINIIERVNIKEAYLNRYERDDNYEYLTVFIKARMGDYIIDEKSGELIKGNKDVEYELGYLIGFIRKNGIKTDVNMSNHSTTNCPNCGAPTTVTSAGQCEYCDSVITSGEFDWVMYEYEGANQTNINNTAVTIKE
jgi:hypothetical protein